MDPGIFNIQNITFKNIRVEERKWDNIRFIEIKPKGQNLTNWVFENITLDSKKTSEGEILGNANAPINTVKFINFRFGNGGALTDFFTNRYNQK